MKYVMDDDLAVNIENIVIANKTDIKDKLDNVTSYRIELCYKTKNCLSQQSIDFNYKKDRDKVFAKIAKKLEKM